MNEKLLHLSETKINELIDKYYNGESTKKLISEYNISISPSQLYTLFPPQVCEQYTCEFCGNSLVLDRVSKTASNNKRYERELYCKTCGHKQYSNACNCENCQARRENHKKEQVIKIQNCYSVNVESIELSHLSFRTKVYLGTICRELLQENLYNIYPEEHCENNIAPTIRYKKIIYDELIDNDVIKVSPDSRVEAFANDENFPNTFYTYMIKYYLNIKINDTKENLAYEILNPSYYCKELGKEAYTLWKEIAIEECIEYLLYQLKTVNFDFTPGDKTYLLFENMLENFSVSQIYGMIWKSIADASKLFLEKNIPKKQAANSVIGACRRLSERALLNKWDMTKYSRIKECPQSIISEFYFNKVLKIGNMGFDMPPTYP